MMKAIDVRRAGSDPLQSALDRLQVGFALFDGGLRLVAWNAAFQALRAYPTELVAAGTPIDRLVRFDAARSDQGADDTEAKVAERLAQLRHGNPDSSEQELADGRILRFTSVPVPPGGLLLTCEDVTEARRAERRLRETEELYDVAMRAISEGVYDWDLVNATVDYSERVRNALALNPDALNTPKDWDDRIHPDDKPKFRAALIAHFKGEAERFECDYRYRALDGSWRWARQHGLAFRDARGRAYRMIGSTGDITELKRAEEALRESEERYALATTVATEGIYEWRVASDDALFLSDRAMEVFGLPPGLSKGRDWVARIHPEDLPGYRQAVVDHFKGRTPVLEHEYRVRSPAGDYLWVRDRAIGVRNAAGRVIKLIGAEMDVTQAKRTEGDLRRARDQAEAAARAKSAFLANMSHELRTPLNAIIGFSEMLAARYFGELTAKQAEYVGDIHASGKHLLSLINDILDLSKVEAGHAELELAELDVRAALENALTLVRERAQRHCIALCLEVAPDVGRLEGDERKLKQIMVNLLSNAVKFAPDGGSVTVAARRAGAEVEIAVRDTGVGIAPEHHAAIFEEFRQVGDDATRRREGTGLGLPLVKRFVALHGGAIRVDSAPGKGSTFTVTLPVRHGE